MTGRPAGGDRLARRLSPPTARKTAVRTAVVTAGRCYGYCRVSTVAQASEGESLDVQQRVLAGYATMQGLTIDRMFVERGVSGSMLETLESFRDSVPAHVRQLLRLLAARCDELEGRLAAVEAVPAVRVAFKSR